MPFDIYKRGFTLSELLIALAILGIISAFTIPKILEAQEQQEAQAKIRETVAALENVWYSRKVSNQVISGTSLYGNLRSSLNTVAASNSTVPFSVLPNTHPCGTPGFAVPDPCICTGWLLFPNGVVVTGLSEHSGWGIDNLPWNHPLHGPVSNYLLCLDHNGKQGPNLPGVDVFYGNFNQWGAFTGPPPSENAKSFNWGSTVVPGQGHVYGYGAAAPIYADSGSVPPAVVGTLLEN